MTKPIHKGTIPYRADIDGLRAMAVFVAVIFHYFPENIPGGFIGVDIFFVISGFLISKIIMTELSDQSFRFLNFYKRRALRFFPALLLLFSFCFIFGGFILMSAEFKQLAKYIVAGAFFWANILLWTESGYFDGATQEKPLMHLWSLGVEEQFYLLWPLLLYLTWKKKMSFIFLIGAVLMISFSLKLNLHDNLTSHFFLPHYRLWELALGGVLAWVSLVREKRLLPSEQSVDTWLFPLLQKNVSPLKTLILSNISSIAGLLLLLWGFYYFHSDFIFPGYWVLVPTIGAFLLIASGPQAWINDKIFSNRMMVYIGLLSFPIYLWHWPLYSFTQILSAGPPPLSLKIPALILTLGAAGFSYHFVENPIRFGGHKNQKALASTGAMILLGLLGFGIYLQGGFTYRQKEVDQFLAYFENSLPHRQYSQKIGQGEAWRSECSLYHVEELDPSCYQRNKKEKALFIWGDSHAQSISSGIRNHLNSQWQVLQIAMATCSPTFGIDKNSPHKNCQKSNQLAIKHIKATLPDVVLIAQLRNDSLEYFESLISDLQKIGINRVIIVGSPPLWKTHLSQILARKFWLHRHRHIHEGLRTEAMSHHLWLQSHFKSDDKKIYADLIGLLCNEEGCLTHLEDDRQTGITAIDELHLSPIASDYVAQNLLVPLITGESPHSTKGKRDVPE